MNNFNIIPNTILVLRDINLFNIIMSFLYENEFKNDNILVNYKNQLINYKKWRDDAGAGIDIELDSQYYYRVEDQKQQEAFESSKSMLLLRKFLLPNFINYEIIYKLILKFEDFQDTEIQLRNEQVYKLHDMQDNLHIIRRKLIKEKIKPKKEKLEADEAIAADLVCMQNFVLDNIRINMLNINYYYHYLIFLKKVYKLNYLLNN